MEQLWLFWTTLDGLHPEIENCVFCVVGLVWFMLIWLWGFRAGRRLYYNACKKIIQHNLTMQLWIRDILALENTSDKHKLNAIYKLVKEDK